MCVCVVGLCLADGNESDDENKDGDGKGVDLGWLRAFPHVLTASMANFSFGYHIGCVPFLSLLLFFLEFHVMSIAFHPTSFFLY